MPRLYLSPTDLNTHAVSITFPVQVMQLTALSGAMDRLLASASRRVDSYCRKRIGAAPATTIGSGGILAGGTSLPMTSTLGYDSGQEQAVVIGTGGTQEIVPILAGGVKVTTWTSPYPGTITLASPTQYAHSAGEPVTGCYQEVCSVGSSSSSDAFSASVIGLSQEAQIAQAHAPYLGTGTLTRVIFLKCYPIISVLRMEHMLPIETQYHTLSGDVGLNPAAGFLRLPLGSFVLPEGLFRTTYTAGYATVPDEVQEATAWYAADEMQNMMSMGAYDMLQGKMRGRYAEVGAPKSRYVLMAEDVLESAGLRRRT